MTLLAHGLVGRQDLPIPEVVFAFGAFVVLVVSFVGLAVLWSRPRFEPPAERPLLRLPAARAVLEPLAGLLGIGAFVAVVLAGLRGSQTTTDNLAPVAVYVIFWVGLPTLSLLLGDVFRPFNPWRAVGRGVGWLAARVAGGRDQLPEPLPYPERLGHWPAVVGLLAFSYLELVAADGDDPSVLATAALLYAAVQLVGMAVYGVEAWTSRGDAFGVLLGLVARLAPLRWEAGRAFLRAPFAGAAGLVPIAGTVALLVVMVGTVSFDGFAEGAVWSDAVPEVQSVFLDAGFSQGTAIELAYTVGMLLMVALVGGLYRLGVLGMRSVARDRSPDELGRAFVHSLVPIALAYVLAHYFSLLAYEGQRMGYLVSDPLGDGSDLLGTATATVDYGVIGANGIWYVQVGALVAGHVAGLVLAHDRALKLFGAGPRAARSQYWMLAVMVSFTCLGLWLLSAASQ